MLTPREQTLSEIRLRQSLGIRKPRRRLPRQVLPRLIEVEYARGITAVLEAARVMAEMVARRWVKSARADDIRRQPRDKNGRWSIGAFAAITSRIVETVKKSAAFSRWFAGSKIVDEHGDPRLMFHATTRHFATFDPKQLDTNTGITTNYLGFYFASNPTVSSIYVNKKWKAGGPVREGGQIKPSFLKITNPYRISEHKYWQIARLSTHEVIEFRENLKRRGYDGIVMPSVWRGHGQGFDAVAFHPDQVRDAFSQDTARSDATIDHEIVILDSDDNVVLRLDSPTSDDFDGETKKFFDQFKPKEAEALAKKFAHRTVAHADEQLKKQAKAALGIDVFTAERGLAQQVEPFITENVALIRSVPKKYFDDVEVMVARAVAEGQRWEDLAVDMQEKFKIAENRAKLIAVDQVGKLYGNIQQLRQQQLGVEKYVWRTVNDNRVRPEHRPREGKLFSWDKPPSDGHPGQAIRCRCFPEPDFSDLLGA